MMKHNIDERGSKSRIRVGCISMHPAPYRDPVLEKLSLNDILEVTTMHLYDIPNSHKEWKKSKVTYPSIFLNKIKRLKILGDYHKELITILKREQFDVLIIPGYYPFTCLKAIFFAMKHKTPFIYAADTVCLPMEKDIKISWLKKKLISRAKFVWTTGKASSQYMLHIGILNERLFAGYYTLQMDTLLQKYQQNKSLKNEYRHELGVSEDEKLILFIGKLIPTRNVNFLLSAFDEFSKRYAKIKLLIVGDGEELNLVKKYQAINANILSIEAAPYEEINRYYSSADCYIHPGAEPYSLALVEAVLAGLPTISTDEVGAAFDYIVDGKNGYVIKKDSAEELLNAMTSILIDDKINEQDILSYNKDFVNLYGVDAITKQLINSIEKCI